MNKSSGLENLFEQIFLLLLNPPFLGSQTNSQQRTESHPEMENPPGASMMKLKGGTAETQARQN